MLNFFKPPIHPGDALKTRQARYVHLVSLIGGLSFLGLAVFVTLQNNGLGPALQTPSFWVFTLTGFYLLFINRINARGALRPAAALLIFGAWVTMTVQAYFSEGIQDSVFFVYIVLFALALSLLSRTWALYLLILSLTAIWGIAFLQEIAVIRPELNPPFVTAFYISVIFIASNIFLDAMLHDLNESIREAERQRDEIEQARQELQGINRSLDARVQERTEALEEASRRANRRAQLLRAIAEISQTISNIRNLRQLLPAITALISEKMGYYHIGIFLVDDRQEYAVLQASNSEGGQRMLARNHKLPIANTSLVGFAANNRRARIALDTGADAVHFDNPDLPDTRSEIAIPILVGDDLIGVLDIQATTENAFSQDDIETFSVLANQIGIAIENARLFEQTQQALEQSQKFYQRFIQQEWQALQDRLRHQGYRYDGIHLNPIEDEAAAAALPPADHAYPIELRGEVVGAIEIRKKGGQKNLLPHEEMLIREAAERIAIAIDNVRLLEQSQQRAAREKLIGEISDQIMGTFSLETLLEITSEELIKMMPEATVQIQIAPQTSEDGEEKP
jgi:GAF domain-containing protein